MSVIEKNIRKTNIQRILHTLCLILPVAAAFGGYFAAPYIWAQLKNNETPELFKFGISLLFFAIPAVIIFILTRKSEAIIKIRIFADKKTD